MLSSNASHLTITPSVDAQDNKDSNSSNLCSAPCDGSSNLSPLSSSSSTTHRISKYFYYVNLEPTRNMPMATASENIGHCSTSSVSYTNLRQKVVPCSKTTQSTSDEKLSEKNHRMSRDRQLTLDRLFSKNMHETLDADDEMNSPVSELTPLDQTLKPSRQTKENGHFNVPLHLKTRLQYTTKGTKALRLLGDGSGKRNDGQRHDQHFNPNESLLNKNAARGTSQRRLLLKNGEVNISRFNIEKRRRQYLADIFTTLIDLKWRYTLFLFTLGFCLSWLAFALIWYLLMLSYGDFRPENYNSANYSVCIAGVHSFAGAILFSIETQQTIGYGTRVVKETCYFAIVVIMLQSSIGVLLQSFMVGVVFAKISRPKKRTETLIWSREAVICLRDGQMTLQCRVGDMRKSHIVEAHVRMYLIKKRVTLEGEVLPLHTYDMNVGFDKGVDRLFLIWPLVIEHVIDEQSPLYRMNRSDLAQQRFELVVILEGIIESTGMTTQARTSYMPSEILWGYRFERLITFQRDDGLYRIDYSRFNLTYPVDTVTCSAKELKDLRELEKMHEINENDQDNRTTKNENIANSSSCIWHEKKESSL